MIGTFAAPTSVDWWALGLSVAALAISVILGVCEAAIVQTSRHKAQDLLEAGKKGADRLVKVVEHRERSVNVLRFIVVAARITHATLLGFLAARLLGGWGSAITIALDVCLVFVLAEAAPKAWAHEHPERAALFAAPFVAAVLAIAPVGWLASGLVAVSRLLVPAAGPNRAAWISEGELLAYADAAVEESVLEDNERDLIESVIDFGDTVAREIMVPRTDMVAFEEGYLITSCVEIAILNGLSRFPVYKENMDDVVGTVYAKDLMRAELNGHGEEPISTLVRPAYFVPETKRVAELLREMQARKTHITIVVDEYGGTAGLATMEDLLEELVGEITDEFDQELPGAVRAEDGALIVSDPSLNVDDLNSDFDLALPEGDWDSIGGLVFSELGRVPEVGDYAEVPGYRLIVEEMDGRRVGRVRLETLVIEEETS
jgi:putative hemolysin